MLWTGEEKFEGLDATVLDFWAWALGDLQTNNTRGLLAEFLVHRAVQATSPHRIEWAPEDVRTPNGTSIEVKASGFLQTWENPELSNPRFAGLLTRRQDKATGQLGAEPEVYADVYVFALQECKDPETYDPLDLAQWDFRVLPASAIRDNGWASIGWAPLTKLVPERVTLTELPAAIAAAALTNASSRRAGL